ncbi:MAG: hypothetical protein JWO67_4888 [Streptosporangiaceae bacterium]|nr:hypothetical protein [Streptosporangiaceae bacterium]
MSTKSARRRRNQRAAAVRTQTTPKPQRTGVNLTKPATVTPLRCGVNLTKPRCAEPANYLALREAAAAATLYAGAHRFHAPYNTWTGMGDGTATTIVADGTRLLYNPGTPGGSAAHLVAWRQCQHDQWHTQYVIHPDQVDRFRNDTARCRQHTTTIQGRAVLTLHNKPREYASA